MPYISYVERRGMKQGFDQGEKQGEKQGLKQGLLEGIAMGLKLKFGVEGERELTRIRNIKDPNVLSEINWGILTAKTLDEIRKIYK